MTTTYARRRRRIAALAATAVAAAVLQTAFAPAAEAGQVGVTIGIQGSGQVVVVEGSLEDGGSSTCDWRSNQDDRVTNYCPRIRNSEPFEAWVWLRHQRPDNPPGHWSFAGWTGCDTTRVSGTWVECGVHSGAFSSDERHPVARFVDGVAPTVTVASAQQLTTSDARFRFTFAVDEAGTTECRVVGQSQFSPCASPVDLTVNVGTQRFEVRGTDASGNVGAARAVDVVGLDTFLYPFTWGGASTADFTYDNAAGAEFICSLDHAAPVPCGTGPSASSSFTGLADGLHVFAVHARLGTFVENHPTVHEWWVDTTAPTTAVTPTIAGRSARFTFPATGTVKQECRLDRPGAAGTWATCVSPVSFTGLADGVHTFQVRSTDAYGNVESPPARHSWTVDGSAPDTTISGPAGFVLADAAMVGLGSTEAGATFTCALDDVPMTCGAAGLALSGLSRGTHVVTAAARDAAGNTDATPAVHTWTVPLVAADLSKGKGWKAKRSSAAYGGTYLQATRKGATLTRDVTGARALALVVGKGRKHGKVKVYAGARLVGTVRLSAAGNRSRQLLPLATFAEPFTGSLRIVVATQDRPVRIEGLGVATR